MKLPDPRRLISGLFPILQWSKSYNGDAAIGDLIAGVTIALTLIPQSIAYASLAGFEPQYGLYASFAGGFIYAVMGTCPQINIGPTALLSLMTFTYTNGTSPEFAVLLCFVAGIVQLIAGVAQLGFLVEFVSLPVVSGFTSAAAITIASSQIKGLLGLRFSAETFLGTWTGVFNNIQDTRMQDTLLSLVCCIILLGMKALKDIRIRDPENEKSRRALLVLQRSLWFAGVSRNAVVVVAAAVVAYFVHQNTGEPLILTGKITAGLPQPSLPPFSATVGNTTYTASDMFGHLGSGLLVVPLVGIISNVAIAKAFARGRTLDATQEIVALGACNLVGAFFKSFPVNGSFTRSAVSDASGVRTPAAGFYTGLIVLLTLALLTPYFYFIPRAALASVIVCAVLHMVDIAIIKRLWKSSRLDLIPLVGTFICCLALGIEVGLICGVGIDVLLLLYYHSRPPLDIKFIDNGNLPPHYSIRPVGRLHFAGAERVRSRIMSLKHAKKAQQQHLETLRIIPDNDYNSNIVRNDVDNRSISVANGHNIRSESEHYVQTRNGPNVQSEIRSDNEVNGGTEGRTNDSQGDRRDIRVVTSDNSGVQSENEGSRTQTNSGQIGRNLVTNGAMTSASSYNILVIYCDALYRMDYTFLQSLKMLVGEWSRSGPIIWCNARPAVKKQLDSVLTGHVYCQSEQLGTILSGLYIGFLREAANVDSYSDTQL